MRTRREQWLIITAIFLGAIIVPMFLSGCTQLGELVPAPQEGDCYSADRVANASPSFGASLVLDGRLVSKGCMEWLKELRAAKEAGIDVSEILRFLEN